MTGSPAATTSISATTTSSTSRASSSNTATLILGPAIVRFTGRAEGDLGHGGAPVVAVDPAVDARRRAVLDRPWSWLRQVHGTDVVVVDWPGGAAGATADAAVTRDRGAALCVLTADCAPVALASVEGVIGVVHAGWRGLAAGIVERTVAAMRGLGAGEIEAVLGPCIHPECYEFSPDDLAGVAKRLGPAVAGRSRRGAPALDLPAAVRASVTRAGAKLTHDVGVCTGCSSDHYSHRARAEPARQAAVVWLP